MISSFLDILNLYINSELLSTLFVVVVPFWVFYWCISTIKYLMWGK